MKSLWIYCRPTDSDGIYLTKPSGVCSYKIFQNISQHQIPDHADGLGTSLPSIKLKTVLEDVETNEYNKANKYTAKTNTGS